VGTGQLHKAVLPRSADSRGKYENGIKQHRRAHFHVQSREPAGLADAGVPFLGSSLGMQRRTKDSLTYQTNHIRDHQNTFKS
jgi:hypothetical protein